MSFYRQKQIEAAAKIKAALELPVPNDKVELGGSDTFDPWEIFPCFYGTYSSAFDEVAIRVLTNLRDKTGDGEELAHEMFREYLCVHNLCDYGTSPRVCFTTTDFEPLLPDFIEKWKAYYAIQWDEPFTSL